MRCTPHGLCLDLACVAVILAVPQVLPAEPSLPPAARLTAPLHWTEPFVRLPACGSYVSMLQRNGQYELWTVAWEGMNKAASHADLIQLTVARGPSSPLKKPSTAHAAEPSAPGTSRTSPACPATHG